MNRRRPRLDSTCLSSYQETERCSRLEVSEELDAYQERWCNAYRQRRRPWLYVVRSFCNNGLDEK
jgi:hypothetical protein